MKEYIRYIVTFFAGAISTAVVIGLLTLLDLEITVAFATVIVLSTGIGGALLWVIVEGFHRRMRGE